MKGKEARGTFVTVPGVFYKGSTGLCWQEGDPELLAVASATFLRLKLAFGFTPWLVRTIWSTVA